MREQSFLGGRYMQGVAKGRSTLGGVGVSVILGKGRVTHVA